MSKQRWRIRTEVALAAVSAVFAMLTVVWKDWIEITVGVDPDHHDGSLEWLIVGVAVTASLVLSILARWELRRLAARVT